MSSVNYSLSHKGVRLIPSSKAWKIGKNGRYNSFGLTHTPKKEYKSISLVVNPNPKDKTQSHLQTKVLTTKKKYMSSPWKDWSWSKEDIGAVRHYKKQYRKRYNKKRR